MPVAVSINLNIDAYQSSWIATHPTPHLFWIKNQNHALSVCPEWSERESATTLNSPGCNEHALWKKNACCWSHHTCWWSCSQVKATWRTRECRSFLPVFLQRSLLLEHLDDYFTFMPAARSQPAPFHHNLWAHLRKGASHLTCKKVCVARETWMKRWRGCWFCKIQRTKSSSLAWI